jgi:hypothetical protein
MMSQSNRTMEFNSKRVVHPDLELKLVRLSDKLSGLRKFKKSLIVKLEKLKSLQCFKLLKSQNDLECLTKTEGKLKEKLIKTNYYKSKSDYYRDIIKAKNIEIEKLKYELSKKSLEIHLPYTYKKRFNEIVSNNQIGASYPRARTSARQEVAIGNVLDFLDRVVGEKNELKQQVVKLKKNVKRRDDSNRSSDPRYLKNNRKFSYVEKPDNIFKT